VIYGIYLDGKVVTKFEGQRWQTSIEVYGREISLTIGDKLTAQQLVERLTTAHYQSVTVLNKPYQYQLTSQTVRFIQPAFQFSEQKQSQQQIKVKFHQSSIKQLWVNEQPVQQVRLVPELLTRLVPDNHEDRQLVNLQQLPELLIDTLLLVEDRDFYHHHGVVPVAILRALVQNLRAGRRIQGGSTLTQQLVKNMFLSNEKTITRKLNEALMALILEWRYSKDQLLEAYINEVYLGQQYANGIYGFGLAAQFYFDKSIEQLTLPEMALLIAEIKGPSYYDPWRHPDRALQRRDMILQLLYEHQLIDLAKYQWAVNQPLGIKPQRERRKRKADDYLALVKQELRYLLPNIEQYHGVKVFTGFDSLAQAQLEHSAQRQLTKIAINTQQDALETAMLVTDIASGQIRALIGSKSPTIAGFNRALQASRQIGSLIKPVIYLAALERYEQYNLATPLMDKPLTINTEDQQWQPQNYDGQYRQQVPLIEALIESRNVPTVNLGLSLGIDNIMAALPMLGIREPIQLQPSMLLGAINLTPLEVNQLYLTIAHNGGYIPQHTITRVINRQGDSLWQVDERSEQRLSENGAYLINYALVQVTQRGTAKSLSWRLPQHVLAGKTGTTNDGRDSWFVGFDQQTLVTTWVGRDDNKPTKLTGSSGALLLFADFMKHYSIKDRELIMPVGIAMTAFERSTGHAVKQACADIIEVPAVQSALIFETCEQPIKQKKRSWFERLFGLD
jgi:penicillin-binding protein 1B